MISAKHLKRHFIAFLLPLVLYFCFQYFGLAYLFHFSKPSYMAYYSRRYDQGLDIWLNIRLFYSAAIYTLVVIGAYELVLLALGGRLKGED